MNSWLLLLVFFALHYFQAAPDIETEKRCRDIDLKVQKIDSLAADSYTAYHNCSDCFSFRASGIDGQLVRLRHVGSCYHTDFYYENNRLVFVRFDGTFERFCGWHEAPYCWKSKDTRDYTAAIYYHRGKVLAEKESGEKPCCPLEFCGGSGLNLPVGDKAIYFAKHFGRVKDLANTGIFSGR